MTASEPKADRLSDLVEGFVRDSCEEHYASRVQKGLCRECVRAALESVIAWLEGKP